MAEAVPFGNNRIKAIQTIPLREKTYGLEKDSEGNYIKPEPYVMQEKKEIPKRKAYKSETTYNPSSTKDSDWDYYNDFYSTDFPDEGGNNSGTKDSGSNVWGY